MNKTTNAPHTNRWDLIGCALSGHETYQPTGSPSATALAQHLHIQTPWGVAWRCLRCGSYVVGQPKYRKSLSHAPLVIRGQVLKQTFILRFLAVERGIRAVLLLVLGAAILHFKSSQGSVQRLLESDIPALRTVAKSIGYNLDASPTFHTIRHSLSLGSHALNIAALVVFAYAAILGAETVGLWLIKRWGEYFSAIATSVFIPLEIYEIHHHMSILKVCALAINIGAVVYLLITKRLFGIRGGGKAYEASLSEDNILEITKSATKTPA